MTAENNEPLAGKRQKATLIILALVFLAPTLGAWLIFNFTDVGRTGTGNVSHGRLINPPRKIDDVALTDPLNGDRSNRLYGKWNLVYLMAGKCDRACEFKLYTMRQVRLAMGRDAERLQRVLVVYGNDPAVLSDDQMQSYKGQLQVRATEQMRTIFKLTENERPLDLQRLYVVDPRGNLMMSYPDGTDPAGIIKDLKRLLKYSSIG